MFDQNFYMVLESAHGRMFDCQEWQKRAVLYPKSSEPTALFLFTRLFLLISNFRTRRICQEMVAFIDDPHKAPSDSSVYSHLAIFSIFFREDSS